MQEMSDTTQIHYTCLLFVSQMRDFRIHITRISENFRWPPNIAEDSQRCSDDFWTLPKIPEDVPMISKGSWRCPNTSEDGILACYFGLKHNI